MHVLAFVCRNSHWLFLNYPSNSAGSSGAPGLTHPCSRPPSASMRPSASSGFFNPSPALTLTLPASCSGEVIQRLIHSLGPLTVGLWVRSVASPSSSFLMEQWRIMNSPHGIWGWVELGNSNEALRTGTDTQLSRNIGCLTFSWEYEGGQLWKQVNRPGFKLWLCH